MLGRRCLKRRPAVNVIQIRSVGCRLRPPAAVPMVFLLYGQTNDECRAPARPFAEDSGCASVELNNVSYDGEPEPESFVLAVDSSIPLSEALEYLGQ